MKTWWAMVVAAFAHATSDDLDAERLKGTDRRGVSNGRSHSKMVSSRASFGVGRWPRPVSQLRVRVFRADYEYSRVVTVRMDGYRNGKKRSTRGRRSDAQVTDGQ